MGFTLSFGRKFATEFKNFPKDQQDKILDFWGLVSTHGLTHFSFFPGKISPSWCGLSSTDPRYSFTQDNSLWHYHIGIPSYRKNHDKYSTSDWVLHFQWVNYRNGGTHINLIDVYQHYSSDGTFYIPHPSYLE
jgi:hypothetical protein